MTYLKKQDSVVVLSGNSKGMKGEVLRVLKDRVVVQGVNIRKKHMKPSQGNQKGSIVQIEKPIHVSNVALEVDGEPVRLRSRLEADGSKVLFYKKGDSEVVYRTLKKGR